MAERRAATKGRRMGSSRRRQLQESSGEAPAAAPSPSEEPPGASEMVQRMQDFFRKQDKDQAGFVTRSDMQKLQEEDFPCSTEELELIFDGLDAAGTGRLSTEEFTAGLWQFLSSQKATRNHRRRKTASRRVRLVLPSPALDGADSEEQRHFAAFMEQLGMDNVSEEQEIWQLWVKLREDEPQLLGNLEDFLAKMRHRIQEARSKKEALKATLNKRVAEHDKEVQQLCEVLEQQIQQEQQRLEQQSVARSHQHGMELQRALDASEREVQRLVMVQMELETRCRSLRSMQQATSTENQQLEESNRVLEDRLQHLQQQLQQTHGRLQTARAAVAWENMEEPGDRVAAELPSEMPPSPQMSPEKSEKNRSEMRTRLGSQSGKPKVKSTHQVVWEMLPAEISLLGAPPRASSTEEDPFPEFLKEEHFSNQSSLLREMNDAIAALSKQLKPQAPGTPPVPADAACHPQDDDEPQTGPEAATAHGTTPGVLQETLPSHVAHKPFEGDLKERPAAAELCAPDTTQAGASVGARHRRALEPGAEQGESPEDARRMLFLQGKGTGVEELMLKAAQHLQEAPGESTEAGEQALMEVEGEGWMQEKIGWEKVQPPGEAEEVALSQGENLETGLGPPEPGEAGLAAGWQLAADELGPAVAPGEHAQPLDVGLGETPDLPSGLSEKLEIKPGEHLEPEPPSQVEARVGAARKDGVLPEVTVAPGPGMLEEERVSAEVQPQGETLDADVLPAPAQHGGSSRARAEEGEVEVTQPREAEPQPQGESARGEAGWGGSVGAEVPLPAAVPPADTQEGGAGTDVQPLEAQSNDANMQLLAELKAALQPLSEAGSLGTEQGGSVAPGVQPLEKDDKPELGLGEEMGAAAVCGEGPSPAETPAGSPDLGGLFPVKAQALETVETEDSQADTQLHGGASPETLQGGGDCAAIHLLEEAEDGEQELGECGLPQEALLYPHGVTIRQGEGAAAGVQSPEEAVMLDMLEVQSSDANVQLLAEVDEIRLTPGVSSETDLQLPSEVRSPGTEQGGSVAPDVQPLGQVDTPELVEVVEAEDSWAEMQLHGRASPETPHGGEDCVAMQLGEEAEDGGQGQGEHGLPHESVLDPQGAGVGQGEGADAGVQLWDSGESLDLLEDESTDANVQPLAEVDELEMTPGGSSETDLQSLTEAGSFGTEQGGSLAPDVQPLDQVDTPDLVELEAEDSRVDMQLHGGLGPEAPRGRKTRRAVQLRDEAEDGGQGLGEHGLPHESVLGPQGAGVGQGEVADAGVQLWDSGESLDLLEDQSTDANVQQPAEADELKMTPGGSTEADLQLPSEVRSLGTEQGGSVAPDVQPLGQVDTPELVEMVEAEDSWTDTQLHGGASPETPQGGEDCVAMQLGEEAEDGEQGQDEHGLPHEPVLHLQGAGVGQGEGADAGVQPPEEAVIMDTLEVQSSDANMQLLAKVDEPRLTPGGSTEADLQPLGEVSSLGTEQGGSVALYVQPLDQADKQELVEMVEAEDSWAEMQLHWCPGPEAPRGRKTRRAVQLRDEAEDGGQGLGEHGLPHESVLDPQGAGVGQGEGADAGVQLWESAESLDILEVQSTDTNVQQPAEADELEMTPGGSMDADLQLPSAVRSPGAEQGGSVAPDVQPLDQVDTPDLVEMVEAEDSWAEMQLRGRASPETSQGGGDHAARQLGDEAEDGGQGLGEHGLPHESVLGPQGAGVGQGEVADAGVQLWDSGESLDLLEDQSTDANVQQPAEADELKMTPGGSTEADLQLPSEVRSLGTEQGGSVAPDVQPLDQVDTEELVEMVEAEDSWADTQLHGGASPETLQRGSDHAAMQLVVEAEDGEQGQGEHGLPHEPVLDLQEAGVGCEEGAGAGVQLPEEAVIPDTLEVQSSDTNMQPLAMVDELRLTPGVSSETGLQPLSEASSLGTEQGGSVAPYVHPLDQVDKHDKQELVELEAEDSWVYTRLRGGLGPEAPRGRKNRRTVQLRDETEDGGQGLGEHGLPHEPVLDPQGAGVGQGEGADAGVQLWQLAESLDLLEDQSTDANVQPLAEVDELRLTPGASSETDLQLPSEVRSPGTEQGGSVAPDVQPLDQVDTPELVEMVEAEDSWTDTQLHGGASPETPQGGEDRVAMQLGEEAEDGEQGQDECGLPHEPVLHLQGAGVGQGEGAGAGVQPPEEAVIPDTLEIQRTDVNVQLLTEAEELKSTSAGSTEADLAHLDATGMWEGEQSQPPCLEAGLRAAHAADTWEGAAGGCVSPPLEAASYPECAAAAEGPGLEVKLGALTGPHGQILKNTQTLELPQGERAAAEGRLLDGAQGLEVVQGERLEAGVSLVETQGLGLKQGRGDGAFELASQVFEVPLQISTLKLETMMQKDVLIPDVRRLGASGQAVQSELQEQVSAQADKVRLHTASQQLKEKPLHVMETEQVAAGPAEPPKQEMPSGPILHMRVQQEEDAGNDQLGMVLGDSSLRDAGNSSMQPQKQHLGEQSEDLNVDQWEKKQEVGRKTSQKGELSPGKPGAVSADGGGPAPRGSPEASLEPDHLYNVLFIGDSHVGKTSFLYRLHADTFNPHLTATVGLDYQVKNLIVDNKRFALRLWDSAGQERYHSMTKQFFRKADGVVLMYDITSEYSFSDVRYWLSCIQEGAEDGVAILLLGNKTDCTEDRKVPTEEGERLAKEHQLTFYECSAASGHNVLESMVSLIRLLKVREDESKNKAAEVPKPPQKKKGCCW
ncbi:ras-related protein Rab-44 [Buteo buteo]|uniref:ras-related protein Rab-44 n=1 Tax=Buteo buteo TaxID=30397 RepID=UPI003EB8A9D8